MLGRSTALLVLVCLLAMAWMPVATAQPTCVREGVTVCVDAREDPERPRASATAEAGPVEVSTRANGAAGIDHLITRTTVGVDGRTLDLVVTTRGTDVDTRITALDGELRLMTRGTDCNGRTLGEPVTCP